MSSGNVPRKINGLWFSSDSLILRAEDAIFRVTKSILAARSPVFQSMLEFPQPTSDDGDETMEGLPVVRLHDSAAQVEPFLLRAIFDSSYFMPPPAKVEFEAVLGILRLSHKYDVDYLHKRALHHLETVYPIDLSNHSRINSTSLNYDEAVVDFDLTAIPILHEVGATWLLPYAYYDVGTFDPETVLEAGKTWETFPIDMRQTFFLLHPHHIRANSRKARFLGDLSTCKSQQSCNSFKFEALRIYVTDSQSGHDLDPLWDSHEYYGPYTWNTLKARLCHDCFAQARAKYDELVAEIWDSLPANCGLEDWGVLMEKRRAALA
ncbi:hypothetical protein C8R44DRAFT_797404 [Mycena epipterygia]|nr:hypothetical protein C8R44DRAFT_797404 [Mycena epipterygia]